MSPSNDPPEIKDALPFPELPDIPSFPKPSTTIPSTRRATVTAADLPVRPRRPTYSTTPSTASISRGYPNEPKTRLRSKSHSLPGGVPMQNPPPPLPIPHRRRRSGTVTTGPVSPPKKKYKTPPMRQAPEEYKPATARPRRVSRPLQDLHKPPNKLVPVSSRPVPPEERPDYGWGQHKPGKVLGSRSSMPKMTRGADVEKSRWSAGALARLRKWRPLSLGNSKSPTRSPTDRDSTGLDSPGTPMKLPDTAIFGTTIAGIRYIRISIPPEADPLRNLPTPSPSPEPHIHASPPPPPKQSLTIQSPSRSVSSPPAVASPPAASPKPTLQNSPFPDAKKIENLGSLHPFFTQTATLPGQSITRPARSSSRPGMTPRTASGTLIPAMAHHMSLDQLRLPAPETHPLSGRRGAMHSPTIETPNSPSLPTSLPQATAPPTRPIPDIPPQVALLSHSYPGDQPLSPTSLPRGKRSRQQVNKDKLAPIMVLPHDSRRDSKLSPMPDSATKPLTPAEWRRNRQDKVRDKKRRDLERARDKRNSMASLSSIAPPSPAATPTASRSTSPVPKSPETVLPTLTTVMTIVDLTPTNLPRPKRIRPRPKARRPYSVSTTTTNSRPTSLLTPRRDRNPLSPPLPIRTAGMPPAPRQPSRFSLPPRSVSPTPSLSNLSTASAPQNPGASKVTHTRHIDHFDLRDIERRLARLERANGSTVARMLEPALENLDRTLMTLYEGRVVEWVSEAAERRRSKVIQDAMETQSVSASARSPNSSICGERPFRLSTCADS